MLHNRKIAIILLVALFSLTPAGVFATPVVQPLYNLEITQSGNETASLEQQFQPSNGKQDIQLISSSSYKDSIGSLYVIDELQNTSPDPLRICENSVHVT